MSNPLDQTPYNFMQYVMTPPRMDRTEYELSEPKTSMIRIVGRERSESGLGQVPMMSDSGGQNSWVMPVVVIVVSAMALMTLYAVLSRR